MDEKSQEKQDRRKIDDVVARIISVFEPWLSDDIPDNEWLAACKSVAQIVRSFSHGSF